MSPEIIELIIKWGPLALIAFTFISCFVVGVTRGTYKVIRRLIYVVLYVVLIWVFIDNITGFVLDFNIPIKNIGSIRVLIEDFIEKNEEINKFLGYSPELKSLVIDNPEILVSPVLFLVLVIVGLPLSLPIYWIYLIIWNLIMKLVFKREKYEKDETGKIIRNEKGKKIKVVRKKRRLLGGLIRGVQGVVLVCLSLMPINFVNRIYNKAKVSADLEEGETLCGSFASIDMDEQVCKYLDTYNKTIFAKMGGENSLDKKLFESLTSAKIGNEKLSLEQELSSVAVSVVLLNESGLLDILMKGEINLETLDLSTINFDKLNLMIDSLFNSYTLSRISEAGVSYVLNEVLKDNLVKTLKDDDIVSKLEFENSEQIKKELKDIVNILKHAVDKGMDQLVFDNMDEPINMVNGVNESDLETLLNKILSLRIITKAMPSVLKAYGENYGVNAPNEMSSELNGEITKTFINAVKLVKTMELTDLEDLTEGNIVDNLANALFEEGALKDNSKDSLATLLHDINSSYMFKDVISSQINKLLKDKDYKVDARVVKYVDSRDAWLKELNVLNNAYSLYDGYNESETINYDNVTGLLNDIKNTKVFISVLPFAYQEFLPKLGIEIDSEGFPVIDFDGENENASKKEFYDTWNDELLILKDVADSIEVLKLQSFDEIDVSLFEDDKNVDAMATMMSKVYESSMLKEPFVTFMTDKINELVMDFEITFTKDELLNINTKDKWENEFNNISDALSVDFSDENNITGMNLEKVFNSVGKMELFKTKKIDILKYAIRESDFLTTDEYNNISWPDMNNQIEVNEFWKNETEVLVDIVDEKEKIETLSTDADLKSLDTNDIGGLLNRAQDSNILNGIIVNKVSKLFIDNGVRDDRDDEGSTVELETSIRNVQDWKKELSSIKQMLNINEDNMDEVASGEIYNNVEKMFINIESSDLLKNTRANLLLKAVKTIDIVSVPNDVTVDVLMENSYEKYSQEKNVIIGVSKNKDSFDQVENISLNTIDTTKVGGLLDIVMKSIIFKGYVVNEILTAFENNDVKDDRDDEGSTVELEKSIANVSDWANELAIIKSMLNMTSETFDDYVDGKTNVEIMFDNIENSQLLKNTRANLLIKAVKTINIDGVNVNNVSVDSLMNNYNGEDYYQYNREVDVMVVFAENRSRVDNLTDITTLTGIERIIMAQILDALEESLIVKDKYESTIDDSLNSIKENQDIVDYGIVFKTANDARNVDWANEIDNLITIKESVSTVAGYTKDSIDDDTADVIDSMLDAVSESAFLGESETYKITDEVIDTLADSSVRSEYNVEFKKASEVGDVDWSKEISNLRIINDLISTVIGYDESSIDETSERIETVGIIGSMLDAVSSSVFLGEEEADKIADKVIKALTQNVVTNVTKSAGKTWSKTFEEALAVIPSL